jgi:hypothetical protein
MTDTLATRQDLRDLETRIGVRFAQVSDRFDNLDIRMSEQEKRSDLRQDVRMADLERRITMRLGGLIVAGVSILAALVKL